jgi:rubrerythrin
MRSTSSLDGGIGKSVQLGSLYKKGVPVKRLADTLEGVIREFHQQREAGESLSAFWQRSLAEHKPEVALPEEISTWQCTTCGYEHLGDAPPGFCPRCAAVKARFARSAQVPEPA